MTFALSIPVSTVTLLDFRGTGMHCVHFFAYSETSKCRLDLDDSYFELLVSCSCKKSSDNFLKKN